MHLRDDMYGNGNVLGILGMDQLGFSASPGIPVFGA